MANTMSENHAYRNMWSMGTRLDILMPGVDDEVADRVYRSVREETDRLENILSIYRETSVFSRLNRKAGETPCIVDADVFHLFTRLLHFQTFTLGYFDITLGTGQKKDRPSPGPDQNRSIILDPEHLTVRFTGPEVRIDSGAFGKGLALNSIKKILLKEGIHHSFISFGESSVQTLGHHPYGDHWKVGIRDLFRTGTNVYVFGMTDGSVSTSGNTPNNKNKYPEGHIINPFTREKFRGYVLMCVSGPDALVTEVLSTALILAGEDEQAEILGNFQEYRAVRISYRDHQAEPLVNELS